MIGPSTLSAPLSGDEPRYFDTFPAFNGSGMTISLWYRHCDRGELSLCGFYFLYAGNSGVDSISYCWTLWIQDNGIYVDNAQANPPYFYLVDFMQTAQTLNHRVWRHLAFVWDSANDHLSVYLDGVLGASAPWGSSVAAMDCRARPDFNETGKPGRVVALGHGLPGWTYSAGPQPLLQCLSATCCKLPAIMFIIP